MVTNLKYFFIPAEVAGFTRMDTCRQKKRMILGRRVYEEHQYVPSDITLTKIFIVGRLLYKQIHLFLHAKRFLVSKIAPRKFVSDAIRDR